jgi:hypothetical protein
MDENDLQDLREELNPFDFNRVQIFLTCALPDPTKQAVVQTARELQRLGQRIPPFVKDLYTAWHSEWARSPVPYRDLAPLNRIRRLYGLPEL